MGTVEKLEVEKFWEPEIGSLVFLNSGSPAMTVVGIYGSENSEDGSDIWVALCWICAGKLEKVDLPLRCIRADMPIFGEGS
jgi:hypothetical protein